MRLTRREFIKLSGAAGAGLVLAGHWPGGGSVAEAYYQSPTGLKKFSQPWRGVGPSGIPVAASDGTAAVTGATHYSIELKEFTDQLHPALGPTTLWGYNPANNTTPRHLGGIIVAHKETPIQITFTNRLPNRHPLPVDTTMMGAEPGQAVNRASVHLHGGFVPWMSDGGPFHWFDPTGQYGASTPKSIYTLLNSGLQNGQAEVYYPNQQSARLMWYHDHAIGITRLNAYAGLASAYIIRDTAEGNLRSLGLPDYVENGGREIPIVIQDKIFVGKNILASDPTWTGLTSQGSLWYPHTYERSRWGVNGSGNAIPNPSVIPEMFGDTMLANGLVYPEVAVEPRRYRLRILNACQARFLNLQLYVDDGSADSITLASRTYAPRNAKGPDFLALGTEGGFLPKPVLVPSNIPFNATTMRGSLITAPAERWDVIVDFSAFAGKKIILYNDAPAPFPMGSPLYDFFPGAPNNPVQPYPGYGPNTRQILRFNVGNGIGIPADTALGITTSTAMPGLDPFLVTPGSSVPNGELKLPTGVPVRQLTLNEAFDAQGRLIQMLGTNQAVTPGVYGRAYHDTATETPQAGAMEVWQIANLTADTHPVHFHLVNVQVLGRQPFNAQGYTGTPAYTGPARGPEATELGWKETVRMHPNEVTTVLMKFTLPPTPSALVGVTSPRTTGYEYVWHCHILEHEEHDMMRPLVVQ